MLSIRPARPEDDDALRALTRRCPMRASVSLRIDREPSFFALTAARGAYRMVVAEMDGALVGVISASRRAARVLGEVTEIGDLADLKVDSAFRRFGVAAALVSALAEIEASAPPALYVAQTAAGNAAVDGVVERFARGRAVRKLTDVVSLQLLPLGPGRARPGFEVGAAGPADRDELAALLEGFHRGRTFAPVFADGGLDEEIARSPGFALADYRVARRGGRIVAAAGVWDQRSLKQTQVIGAPWPMRALAAAFRAGSWVLPLPALPAPGGALDFRAIRHAAYLPGEEAGLRSILRVVVGEARARGEHFALYTAPEGDPLLDVARGMPSTTYRYALVAATNRAEADPLLARLGAGPWYDDGALA